MNTRVFDVLSGKEDNYLLPFLWQRGESEAVIREEMAKVFESGIKAVCVEARPHPDFLGPRWWHDFDIIMDEARRRGMRVWVLDDDHFPTGHAAGKVTGAPAALRRRFLQEFHVDAIGPCPMASFPVKTWLLNPFAPGSGAESETVAVIAARRDAASDALTGEFVDLSAAVQDGMLYWDVPAGYWRIFLLTVSSTGGSERQKDYINPLVAESTRVLLDAVYEAFYAHCPGDFGRTFAGFFSDEPGFYNDKTTFDFQSRPGKKGVALPWRAGLLDLLSAKLGADFRTALPLLWHDCGELSSRARYAYMDVVSRLYADNFTAQIGDWCRAHNVEYIGHVLEDNSVHCRLGPGTGHFFRALWGQDMSGLDVVLWQLAPGFDEGPFTNTGGDADGEFYHYGLAKMGSSLAHIDPKKQGRTMCEIFGAFGWREGLKLMKWMTDHMLVRGVTHFVPHAFSQAEFPDHDCPPHFYARGKNPQYRYYRELNRYTNRISHLLSGGRHVASAAALYHAEAEWSGACMPFHKPVRVLMQNQVDCDVLPGDILLHAGIEGGRLRVQAEDYSCLVIPFSEALPADLLRRLADFAQHGLPLFFIDGLPARASEGQDAADALGQLAARTNVAVMRLDQLASMIRNAGLNEIHIDGYEPYLHFMHVAHPDLDVYMFVNEHPIQRVKTEIHLPGDRRVLAYDAFANRTLEVDCVYSNGSRSVAVDLSPYESLILLSGEAAKDLEAEKPARTGAKEQVLCSNWQISTATSEEYPRFAAWRRLDGLSDLSRPDTLPTFSGTFRYETSFDWTQPAGTVLLDLGEVFETAEVWVNGQPAGVRICPPYVFEIGDDLRAGENSLIVDVTNTLVKNQRDFLSRYAQDEPSGLLGPVRLLY